MDDYATEGLDPRLVAALQEQAAHRLLAAAQELREAEPITAMDTTAISLNTWFGCLVRAGFTEDQALKYLAWRDWTS